jgi:hypothetical protein
MKLSQNVKYGLAALGFLFVILFGLLIFASTTGKKVGERQQDPNVCEFCGKALGKSGECLPCKAEMGPEVYQSKRDSKYWYNSPVIPTTIITLLCLLALVYIALRLGKINWKRTGDVYYYIRCTKCGRKLRYREAQINHAGRCPLCHKPILFPKPSEENSETTWRKIVHYVWG